MTSTVGAPAPPRRVVPVPPPMDRARRRAVLRSRLDRKFSPYLYVAPFFLLFGLFGLFPVFYTAYVSLFDWELAGDREYLGLQNYAEVMTDDRFWNSVYNTFGIWFVSTIPQLLLALMVANVLNRQIKARTAFRMGVLVPNITSVAAVGIVFGLIFADQYGLANWLVELVGLDPISWRLHRWSSWLAIAFMVDWRWTGYNALIYLAAMQAIPKDMYEAASIDGASRWRQFWQITVPMIRPTILFTILISTIGGMQLFTEPLMFGYGRSDGGTQNEYQTVAMYIYRTTFEGKFDYGYGAAISWVLFLLIILFALVNFLLVRRSVKGDLR